MGINDKIMAKRISIILVIVLVAIQFFRPEENKGNLYAETHIKNVVSVPPEVETILQNACYDCHSNETQYPWYNKIQPVAWWLANHVDEGKSELNFSMFATYNLKRQKHKLDEIAEQLREHEMPLESYTWIHKKARLNNDDIELLALWALHGKELLNDTITN